MSQLQYILNEYNEIMRSLKIAIENEPEKELSNIKRYEQLKVYRKVVGDLQEIEEGEEE